MTRLMKTMAGLLLIGMLLGAAMIAAAVAMGGPFDDAVIQFNDQSLTLAQMNPGHWAIAAGGMLLAFVVVIVVVPLAVLVPLLIVGLVLLGVLMLIAGLAALVFSPLILLAGGVWLIWRLARGDAKPSATITG